MCSEFNKKIPWPIKDSKLFIGSGEKYEYSQFGWSTTEYEFYGYMKGYKEAADSLIKSAINSQDISKIDTFIYPICFLYRQYLELTMKNIYLFYSEETKEIKINTLKEVLHDLMKIWNKIKPLLKIDANKNEINDIEAVEGYILQFHKFDQSSFTFRYPIDKNLRSVIGGETKVNLLHLQMRMDELYNFFNGVISKLDYTKEITDKIIEFFAQIMKSEY